jgi:hypothetical protein
MGTGKIFFLGIKVWTSFNLRGYAQSPSDKRISGPPAIITMTNYREWLRLRKRWEFGHLQRQAMETATALFIYGHLFKIGEARIWLN